MRSVGRRVGLYALIGALLGLGAPVGLVLVRAVSRDELGLYLYVGIGTVLVMTVFGAVLGAKEDALARLSWNDALTGLGNRRLFDQRLREELARAARRKTPLSLMILDIDRFKRVNDTFGHVRGDFVLRTIAEIARDSFREGDVVCRYGGEEIAVIAPETQSGEAHSLAERVRERIEQTEIPLDGTPWKLTVSVGVAESLPGEKPDAITDRADEALYRAKREGRNRTCVASAVEMAG